MGHWADDLLPDVKERLGIRGDEEDARIRENIRRARERVELLAGRAFGSVQELNIDFKPEGLPFVPVPDLHPQPREVTAPCWAIPDPVHPDVATVMQVAVPESVRDDATPTAEALRAAGRAVAQCVAEKRFTNAVWVWLALQRQAGPSDELVRNLLDPNVYVQVPVIGGESGGWWVQVSRRLRLVTKETPEDHRLVQRLVDVGEGATLAASEPMLIVARLTEHPVTWAMAVRIWMVAGSAAAPPWRMKDMAGAIRAHGMPIISIDDDTTPDEAAAQLLLAAHWYGYLAGEESAIPPALGRAFPREVALVQRGTHALDAVAAATQLFERLDRPGFDPSRGATFIRRYVRRQASTLVKAHRTAEMPDQPWERLGISQRYYYRLLARFSEKSLDGRYDVDSDLLDRLRSYLKERGRRQAALELLRSRGYGDAAARKWLQRHPLEAIRAAWPRGARSEVQTPIATATSRQARSSTPSSRRR